MKNKWHPILSIIISGAALFCTAQPTADTPTIDRFYSDTPTYQFKLVPDQLTLLANLLIMQTTLLDATEQNKRNIELPLEDDVITESIELCSRLSHHNPELEWSQLATLLAGSRAWCVGCNFLNDLNNIKYWIAQMQSLLAGQQECLELCTKLIGATDHGDGQPFIGTTGLTIDSTMPGGHYCLREYVLTPSPGFVGTDAITVTRDDVLIDLQGNTINGNGLDIGGILFSNASYGTVQNGTITNFNTDATPPYTGYGVRFTSGSGVAYQGATARDLVLTDCGFYGLYMDSGDTTNKTPVSPVVQRVAADRNLWGILINNCFSTILLRDCRARRNDIGFDLGFDNTDQPSVANCSATGNSFSGFSMVTTARISNCIALANTTIGFVLNPAVRATTNFARSNGTNYSGLAADFTAQNMAGLASHPFGANIDGDLP